MRRKSSRSARKSSPENTKAETQKTSRKQSSRRHKRSSSRSDEESNEEVTQPEIREPLRDHVSGNPPSGDEKSDGSKYVVGESVDFAEEKAYNACLAKVEQESPEGNTSGRIPLRESPLDKEVNEDFQEREVTEEKELKNKGKSKGKNYSNIEKSSNNFEPETENENVQGTPQSPSKDNADNENVQNVNDTTRTNTVVQEEKLELVKSESEGVESQQQLTFIGEQTVCFESEYTQKYINQDTDKSATEYQELDRENANQGFKHSILESCDKGTSNMEDKPSSQGTSYNADERSTTPEPKLNTEILSKNSSRKSSDTSIDKTDKSRRKSSTEEKGYRESTNLKKKITLRRSPPENKVERRHSSTSDEHKKDTYTPENKSGKRITLKRQTIDEKTSISEEKVADSAENVSSRRTSAEFTEKKRRLSSLCEDKGQDTEEKPKNSFTRVKLIRNFSRENNEINEEKRRLAITQRQKWSRLDWLPKMVSSFYTVDVESIKIVCPNLKFLNENEVKLESTPKERRKSESGHRRKVSLDTKSEDSDQPEYEKQTSEDSSGDAKIELNPNIIAMNRKISIVDDTASKLRPPPSPAKHPTSDVLFITNLVRPFTVKQLKELLERTGQIREGGFWTDRIKSKCYVHYDSVEEAEATRNALHGVHWPIGNGKKLIIDYATVEDLEKAKNPPPVPVIIPEKLPEKENREPEKVEIKFKEREREERRTGAVREWDLGKEEMQKGRSRSRSKSRERARKHSRRSYTPEIFNNHKKTRKVEEPIPQKLMDDLFLKTKATPSIYWQPLSPDEIMKKQQQRLVRMEEHKRRIEETRGRGRDNRRGPFRRR